MKHTQSLVGLLKLVSTPEDGKFAPVAVCRRRHAPRHARTALKPLAKLGRQRRQAQARSRAASGPFRGGTREDEQGHERGTTACSAAARPRPRSAEGRCRSACGPAGAAVEYRGADRDGGGPGQAVRSATVPELLVAGWKGFGPALRGQVIDVLLRSRGLRQGRPRCDGEEGHPARGTGRRAPATAGRAQGSGPPRSGPRSCWPTPSRRIGRRSWTPISRS